MPEPIINTDFPKYPQYGTLRWETSDETGLLHVLEDFEYKLNPCLTRYVEAGFESDRASIPIIIRALFPPDGRYTKAALVHDKHYSEGGMWKLEADWWFFKGMLVLNVPMWKALIFFAAVATVGWVAWWKHRLS